MKKHILLLVFATAILLFGCIQQNGEIPPGNQTIDGTENNTGNLENLNGTNGNEDQDEEFGNQSGNGLEDENGAGNGEVNGEEDQGGEEEGQEANGQSEEEPVCLHEIQGDEPCLLTADEHWHSEIVDNEWAGIDSSIAVDSLGNPHISHYDQEHRNLKHSYIEDGEWKNEVVDSTGDVGEESGIAVDSNNNIHISYKSETIGALKYAKKQGDSWTIEIVYQEEGLQAMASSIALDSNENPHILFNLRSEDDSPDFEDAVRHAYLEDGSWKVEPVSYRGLDLYLVIDLGDNLHVCFVRDYPNENIERIHYAEKSSGEWTLEIVDSFTKSGGDCGISTDSNNNPHIAYHDYGNGAIKYAVKQGNSWDIETVASNIGNEEGLKIKVDNQDISHIIFINNKEELLIHAFLEGSSWEKEIVDKMGNPSITIDDSGKVHVSYGHSSGEEADVDPSEYFDCCEKEILKYAYRESNPS